MTDPDDESDIAKRHSVANLRRTPAEFADAGPLEWWHDHGPEYSVHLRDTQFLTVKKITLLLAILIFVKHSAGKNLSILP